MLLSGHDSATNLPLPSSPDCRRGSSCHAAQAIQKVVRAHQKRQVRPILNLCLFDGTYEEEFDAE